MILSRSAVGIGSVVIIGQNLCRCTAVPGNVPSALCPVFVPQTARLLGFSVTLAASDRAMKPNPRSGRLSQSAASCSSSRSWGSRHSGPARAGVGPLGSGLLGGNVNVVDCCMASSVPAGCDHRKIPKGFGNQKESSWNRFPPGCFDARLMK
jgi:hypothetical protein